MKRVMALDSAFIQLNLASPHDALSYGYRVWGVKMSPGYEGNQSSIARANRGNGCELLVRVRPFRVGGFCPGL